MMKLRARVFIWSLLTVTFLVFCVLYFNLHYSLVTGNLNSILSGIKTVRLTIAVATEETNLTELPPFQPWEEAEFPVSENTKPRIPHILHQIFCYDKVPEPYRGFIQTFIKQNPTWQYRFWSHDSGWKFLKDRVPELVPSFEKFGLCDQKRTNILKYAVLHEYGGVYADFDMENLRPLDRATLKYSCIIPLQPFEETAMKFQSQLNVFNFDHLKDNLITPTLQTDILFCRANHSFLKLCIKEIQRVTQFASLSQFGGDSFITTMFLLHNNLSEITIKKRIKRPASNSPYFYKGERPEDGIESVYIPNSQYFYDSVDPLFIGKKTGNLNRCWNYNETDYLALMGKFACREFERRKEVRKSRRYTFVVHHCHNSKKYDYKRWIDEMKKTPIKEVVPGCILYDWSVSKALLMAS